MIDRLRPSSLALALALALPLVASPHAAQAGDQEMVDVVDVKIELRQENGKVVKHAHRVTALGIDKTVEFEGAEHHHAVLLNVDKVDGGTAKFKVRFGYERDGVAIIAPFESEFAAKKRDAMWTDDGKYAIALTFTPKKAKAETNRREDQVDPGHGDDPLD